MTAVEHDETATTVTYRKDYVAPYYLVDTVELDFEIVPNVTTVKSVMTCKRNTHAAADQSFFLNGEDLTLVSIHMNGTELQRDVDVVVSAHGLTIKGEKMATISGATPFELTIVVTNCPEKNTQLSGLYKSSLIYSTQCEALGFRRITYFPDRPDVMAVYKSVRVVADKASNPVLLSNGNMVASGDLDNGRHYATFSDMCPKPSYLFALVAGTLSHIEGEFVTGQGKTVALKVFSEPKDSKKLDWALESIRVAMKWDEEKYGRYYDYEVFNVVAVSDFNMGAMENTTLNIFNTSLLLASEDTATDATYNAIRAVIGHEYFHHWTGNKVTLSSWFNLTLKEGLTVFRDQSFSADTACAVQSRLDTVALVRGSQFNEDSGPTSHPIRPDSFVSIENFYTLTVYRKGAEVIRMFHTALGAEGYRKGTDLYFQRHEGQAVTCDEFLQAMRDANPEIPLTHFERWYSTPGTPTLFVDVAKFDADSKQFKLKLRQESKCTEGAMFIPIKYALISKATGKLLKEGVHTLLELSEDVSIPCEEDAVVSVLRNFSAPVRVQFAPEAQTMDDILFLMAHEVDPVNKWDASQKVATSLVKEAYHAQFSSKDHSDLSSPVIGNAKVEIPAKIVDAYRRVVVGAESDRGAAVALAAASLCFPDFKTLLGTFRAEVHSKVNPNALVHARAAAVKALAAAVQDVAFERYNQVSARTVGKKYEINTNDIADRSLRSVLLNLLVLSEHPEATSLAVNQYNSANNLTERLGAMNAIVNTHSAESKELLDKFYQVAKDDKNLLDRWFTVQAAADTKSHPTEMVEMLVQHEKFTYATPNRLRAVFTMFAASAPGYHHDSYAGYDCMTEAILKVDGINHSQAARLCANLTDYKKYDDKRAAYLKQCLEKIKKEAKSTEVLEIVNMALDN